MDHGDEDQTHCDSAGGRRSGRRSAGDRRASPDAHPGCGQVPEPDDLAGGTLLREKAIPSFVLGKRRVVVDRYVERRNAMARTEASVSEEEETIISLEK